MYKAATNKTREILFNYGKEPDPIFCGTGSGLGNIQQKINIQEKNWSVISTEEKERGIGSAVRDG